MKLYRAVVVGVLSPGCLTPPTSSRMLMSRPGLISRDFAHIESEREKENNPV